MTIDPSGDAPNVADANASEGVGKPGDSRLKSGIARPRRCLPNALAHH
ncbi:hypothetical protein LC593_27415 [Nostoc sp. CHAB 5844]|nr:hypothetical protein [Nostoc sp. CHAB 5844]